MNKFIRWLRCEPSESDLFLVHIREVIQCFFGTVCEWEQKPDIGEEEHGINPSIRCCKLCGKRRRGFYHRFGDIRVTWEDEILPESIQLPHAIKK